MESPEYCVVCKLRIDKAFILLFFSWLNFGFLCIVYRRCGGTGGSSELCLLLFVFIQRVHPTFI